MPFDVWMLHSQPGYLGPRSGAELRLRTLLGVGGNPIGAPIALGVGRPGYPIGEVGASLGVELGQDR
jgi:hypothetical protein